MLKYLADQTSLWLRNGPMKPVRTIVLAKVPMARQVKTRLIPALGQQGAADHARAMLHWTLEQALKAGIGTDCPELDAACLRHAVRALPYYDAVMAPSVDGGYALLGLNRFHASIFANIAWSTDAVACTTQQRLAQLAWRTYCLPMVHDIDVPEDLRWLGTVPQARPDGAMTPGGRSDPQADAWAHPWGDHA